MSVNKDLSHNFELLNYLTPHDRIKVRLVVTFLSLLFYKKQLIVFFIRRNLKKLQENLNKKYSFSNCFLENFYFILIILRTNFLLFSL